MQSMNVTKTAETSWKVHSSLVEPFSQQPTWELRSQSMSSNSSLTVISSSLSSASCAEVLLINMINMINMINIINTYLVQGIIVMLDAGLLHLLYKFLF